MNDVRVMQVQDRLCQLVDNKLFMFLLQMFVVAVLPNQSMQINVHMLKNEVNIFVILGPDCVVDADDVLMFELFEKHDLTVGSLGVCGVCEGVKIFFEGFELLGLAVCHFPDDSVSATSDFLYGLV